MNAVAAIDKTEHTTYVEPYGCSVAVLMSKKLSPVEVFNDVRSDVVNFFRALRANDLERARSFFPDAQVEDMCQRLRTVQIEHLDPFEVMRRYDSIKTLHYVDPPNKDAALLEFLKTLKGKVVLK